MHATDFYACTHDCSVYCNGCLPEGVDVDSEDVHPIFANSEWSSYPTCDNCGACHDYVTLLPARFEDTKINTWFERDRQYVELVDSRTNQTIVEWWDEDVSEAIADGFLDARHLHKSAFNYAMEMGVVS